MTFNIGLFFSLIPVVGQGALITLFAAFTGYAIALLLGLVLAFANMSSWPWVSMPSRSLLHLVRSTPLLLQLYVWFYVLPHYGITLSALTAGILGLGLHYATYVAEVYRSGIQNVPRGQWEASAALGLSPTRTWVRVVLPQAIRVTIPPLGNYLIGIFKSTPYLSTITVGEMLERAMTQASLSFRYVEPLVLVGLIFLGVSYTSALGVRWLERRFAPHQR